MVTTRNGYDVNKLLDAYFNNKQEKDLDVIKSYLELLPPEDCNMIIQQLSTYDGYKDTIKRFDEIIYYQSVDDNCNNATITNMIDSKKTAIDRLLDTYIDQPHDRTVYELNMDLSRKEKRLNILDNTVRGQQNMITRLETRLRDELSGSQKDRDALAEALQSIMNLNEEIANHRLKDIALSSYNSSGVNGSGYEKERAGYLAEIERKESVIRRKDVKKCQLLDIIRIKNAELEEFRKTNNELKRKIWGVYATKRKLEDKIKVMET